MRPTSAAAASCCDRAAPISPSVGFGGGGGTASAGAAVATSAAPARTADQRRSAAARAGRAAPGRRAPGRAVAGPDGRRWNMTGSLGKREWGVMPGESRSVTASHKGNTRHSRRARRNFVK